MTKYTKGKIVKGTVTCIETYGAFLKFDDYYTGLLHISEISHKFVKEVTDFFNIGDSIFVEVLEVDEETHQLNLSIKNIEYKPNKNFRKKTIIETEHGFTTLSAKLPIWINQKMKTAKKNY